MPHPARRVWLLNFDAESELEDPSARTPSRAVLARHAALAERVRGLYGPGDAVLLPGGSVVAELHPQPAPVPAPVPESSQESGTGTGTGAGAGTGPTDLAGRAWCPTPGALAALARAGAHPPPAPPFDVLRRVNHRRFCADLGQTLDGARYVTTEAELRETLAAFPGAEAWVMKRPYGFAGRGQLRFSGRTPGAMEERWIAASLAAGEGLQVEPWVERAGDFGLHGHIAPTGAVMLGEPTVQRCDARGAWVASERAGAGELSPAEHGALVRAAEEAATALAAAGYFGPFGVDAFRYRDAGGAVRFNARCEINARYSMGWHVGMGERRPDLLL